MKEENFDWLLSGCHALSRVAQAYYPCELNTSSIRSFRKHVRELPALYADLLSVEYTDKLVNLTPLQNAVIVRHLGFPDQVKREHGRRKKEGRGNLPFLCSNASDKEAV